MTTQKGLNYYLSLPYTIQLIREDGESWFARVLELPGCMTEGDSPEEVVEMIFDAMAGWLEIALEDGRPIPEPRPVEDYSGKFVVRVPRTLHRQLVEASDRESVSLNQYINVILAEGVTPSSIPAPMASSSPNWPGLSTAIRRALMMAGLDDAAGQLDERLFADWIEHALAEAERSLRDGFFQDALKNLGRMALILEQNAAQSPLCGVMAQMLAFQQRSIEAVFRPQQGVMQEPMLYAQLARMIKQANSEQLVMTEERRQYSAAASAPEYSLPESFFQSHTKVKRENAW
jgi:antitoxin HicB